MKYKVKMKEGNIGVFFQMVKNKMKEKKCGHFFQQIELKKK